MGLELLMQLTERAKTSPHINAMLGCVAAGLDLETALAQVVLSQADLIDGLLAQREKGFTVSEVPREPG